MSDNESKRNRLLHEILPYRMMAVNTMHRAIYWRGVWPHPTPMQIYADGKVIADGNLNAFINPAVEAGLVHCRALLEFLGLKADDGRLVNVRRRRRNDIGIEHFSNYGGPLPMANPEAALACYGGGTEDAEKALVAVFEITNKGIAHVTEDLRENPDHGRLFEIASLGVPSLVISYLYTPLGLPAPTYKLTHRPRDSSEAG